MGGRRGVVGLLGQHRSAPVTRPRTRASGDRRRVYQSAPRRGRRLADDAADDRHDEPEVGEVEDAADEQAADRAARRSGPSG